MSLQRAETEMSYAAVSGNPSLDETIVLCEETLEKVPGSSEVLEALCNLYKIQAATSEKITEASISYYSTTQIQNYFQRFGVPFVECFGLVD